jgi:hypothetical protein
LVPNTSTPLQITLAAEAHLAEGQFLPEEQTLNKAKSMIYRAGTRRPTVSKRGHTSEASGAVHGGGTSSHVRCVILTPSICITTIMGMKREIIKQLAANSFWIRSCLLASMNVIEFQTTEACSRVDLKRVKYNRHRGTRGSVVG